MNQLISQAILCIVFLLLTITGCGSAVSKESIDIAIINGRVIDPETGLDAIRNVGIHDSKIVLVTEKTIAAPNTIDAEGLVVSPGFIDMHAHGQSILANRVQAFDGVTTALELEAGTYPINEFYDTRAKEGRPVNYGASVSWASARIAILLNETPSSEISWFMRMFEKTGWQNTVASNDETANITRMVEKGLDEGGLGVGFLTGYAPGSGHKEYYNVSKLAADRQLPTFTHARFLSMLEPNSSFEGIQEIIAVAASTGVHAHIVHLNSISLRDINLIRDTIVKAQHDGIKLSTEAYPYGAGSTGIGAEMFRGTDWKERIGGISAENFEIDGRRLTTAEFNQLQRDKPGTDVIVHFLDTEKAADQALLDTSLLMPDGVVASDGGDWMKNGELVEQNTWPLPKKAWSHPRSAGTFSRFISHYVRDAKKLSLLQAIRKTSYLPTTILQDAVPQMKMKGRIQPGADADIVIFSLDELSDTASFSHSASLSKGVEYLLVNGEIVIEQGKLDTSSLPGRPVRNKQKDISK